MKATMKAVTYLADFGSPHRPYTGGYYFASCLLRILRELPINLTVFSVAYPNIDLGESYISGEGIAAMKLPTGGFGNPWTGFSWVRQLRRRLQKMPAQDLYIFDQPMTLARFLPQAPALAMFHGSDFVRWQDLSLTHPRDFIYGLLWRKLFLNRVHRKFLTKAIGIPLFNSRDTLTRLAADFQVDPHPLEKYITYLPIETDKFRFDEEDRVKLRQKYNLANDEIVIIALSNFDPVKRADRLTSMITNLFNQLPNEKIRFLLVGGGRQSQSIDELIKKTRIADRLIRVGEVPHTEVYKYYSAADIALSTSQRESFGYFITEGMSVGLPFVAYRGGAIEEVIDDSETGFVVESEEDFLTRLITLIQNKALWQKMGEAGRTRVESMFSLLAFKKRFLSILDAEFGLQF